MPDANPAGSPTRRRYRGADVDISFDGKRCRHAAECLRGLPTVFDVKRRPWILPDGAAAEEVMRVVALCPTGALQSHPAALPAETPTAPTEVTPLPGGPLLLRGDLSIHTADTEERQTRAALCSCGRTANAPYCDGGGTCADWPHARGS